MALTVVKVVCSCALCGGPSSLELAEDPTIPPAVGVQGDDTDRLEVRRTTKAGPAHRVPIRWSRRIAVGHRFPGKRRVSTALACLADDLILEAVI